jgi:hypothetical protein
VSDGITAPLRVANVGAGDYEGLRRALARRIRVDFEHEGAATNVVIRGHAQHEVRLAIEPLCQPGQWPNIGDLAAPPS